MAALSFLTTPSWARDRRRSPERMRASMAVAVAAIALLNLADLLTTRAVLARPGAIESNPLAALLLGTGWAGLLKGGLILALILRIPRRKPTVLLHAFLWFVAGFYFLTVLSNLLVLQRLA